MRNKLCLLCLCLVLLLVGCTPDASVGGSEKTVPLDHILSALRACDAALYEAAFPPTFCTQYDQVAGSLREHVDELLQTAHDFDLDRYGSALAISYMPVEIKRYDVDSLESRMQSVSPAFVYTLPIEQITDAALVTVQTTFDGSYLTEQFDVTYLVLCIDGNWYLHPKHFLTVLKN